MNNIPHKKVLDFWFSEEVKEKQFSKDPLFDQYIRDEFGLAHWLLVFHKEQVLEEHAASYLAGIIILDQFSRNMFRNTPYAFGGDEFALPFAKHAISKGYHKSVDAKQMSFFFMPFMHSEKVEEQLACIELFKEFEGEDGEGGGLEYAHKHHVIIERFGRFPHRNAILGRTSTPEEIEFLKTPDSSF